MRDVALITGSTEDGVTWIDIDIVNGEPVYLDYESQTYDQRAALSVYAAKGTFPGELDFGVSWESVYDKEDTTIQLSNELQQQVTQYAGRDEDEALLPQTSYTAQLLVNNEGVGVIVSKG